MLVAKVIVAKKMKQKQHQTKFKSRRKKSSHVTRIFYLDISQTTTSQFEFLNQTYVAKRLENSFKVDHLSWETLARRIPAKFLRKIKFIVEPDARKMSSN